MTPRMPNLAREHYHNGSSQLFVRLTAVLCALLRNCVRTKASAVRIEWDERAGRLLIEDDGMGTGALEAHFLRDFAATFIGSERSRIESHDWRTTREGENEPISVTQSARSGTCVTLHIHRKAWPTGRASYLRDGEYAVAPEASAVWRAMLLELTRGFPVPVSFQGSDLPRPHALNGALSFDACTLGQMHLHLKEQCEPDSLRRPAFLYCEGLPLMPERRASECSRDVMHIERREAELTSDAHELLARAQAIRIEAWQQRLRERHAELDLLSFTTLHWPMCVEAGLSELLADAPITASMLSAYDAPVTALWTDAQRTVPWLDHSLPERDSVLIEPLTRHFLGDGFDPPAPLASIYALAKNLAVLDARVPACHWANSRVVDLLDPKLALNYTVRGEIRLAPFDGRWVQCQVLLCESVEINFSAAPDCTVASELRALLTPIMVSELAFYDPIARRIVVPAKATNVRDVIAQAASFRDDNDYFHERIFEHDEHALRDVLVELRKRARVRSAPNRPRTLALSPHPIEARNVTPRRARSA